MGFGKVKIDFSCVCARVCSFTKLKLLRVGRVPLTTANEGVAVNTYITASRYYICRARQSTLCSREASIPTEAAQLAGLNHSYRARQSTLCSREGSTN